MPPGTGSARRPPPARPVALAVLAAVALCLAVVAAGTLGPVPRDARDAVAPPAPALSSPPVPADVPTASPATGGTPRADEVRVEISPQVLLVVGLGLAAALVVRLLLMLGRRDVGTGPGPGPDVGRRAAPGVPGLPAGLARTAREQAATLRRADPRSSGDAVVACWLRLEDVAARAGRRRRPSQTPTQFTVGVLERVTDDRDAVAELLGLYHRARFGSRPLPDDAAARAAAALTRIAGPAPPGDDA
jgi:hypothetical protein